MKIIIKNNYRLLVKDDGSEVNIHDDAVVEYTGVYYKYIKNEISNVFEKQTNFVGIVTSQKYADNMIQGIYIKPMYIWSIDNREWLKINDYKPPVTKYFLYPHLLLLPEINSPYRGLYFLNTCCNIQLSDFNSITKEFSLNETDYNE